MRKSSNHSSPLVKEILSIVVFTIGLGILLSLLSYNAADQSFSVYHSSPKKIHNLLGVVGSFTADFFLQAFGLASFLLVAFLIILAVRLFLSLNSSLSWLGGLSWVGLIMSVDGILSLSLGTMTVERWGNFSGHTGGITGYLLTTYSTKYLNTIGSYIVLTLVLILSLMGTVNFSLRSLCSSSLNGLTAGKSFLGGLVQRGYVFLRKQKERKKKAQSEPKTKKSVSSIPKKQVQNKQKEPAIVTPPTVERSVVEDIARIAAKAQRTSYDFKLPTLDLLNDPEKKSTKIERQQLIENSRVLENKLADFGVQATVVNVHPGPLITMYELEPAPGVKINRIVNLADDLALALRAEGIRIVAPIPGKGAIGVELPNPKREIVCFKEIVSQEAFLTSRAPLTMGMGKDISGMPIISDLATMPHLLIAGTTGSGKSVFMNTLICSLLYKVPPSEVKLLIVDPKRSEFTLYEDIPHLLYPVVTDAKQAADVLRWAVEEMERRYHLLATIGARDIYSYNKKVRAQEKSSPPSHPADPQVSSEETAPPMPWIVIVIDELANLMMVSSRDVELSLARLAQMARAAGIHLLVATQRPSVDVITGTIKANFPARISFRLTSKTDSRIIIDGNGAENLLNKGDMLFMSPRTPRLKRIHGPYISDEEITRVVKFVKAQAKPEYQELNLRSTEDSLEDSLDGGVDDKYREAVALVTSLEQASISLIQRKMRIGYNRAARIIEQMEEDGIVSAGDGVKPREVLRKMVDI